MDDKGTEDIPYDILYGLPPVRPCKTTTIGVSSESVRMLAGGVKSSPLFLELRADWAKRHASTYRVPPSTVRRRVLRKQSAFDHQDIIRKTQYFDNIRMDRRGPTIITKVLSIMIDHGQDRYSVYTE